MLRLIREWWTEAQRRATLPYPHEWEDAPPLEVDDEGWLVGEGVVRMPMHPSWRYSGLKTASGEPVAVTWHYTATDAGTALAMARRRTQPRSADDRAASWHLSIETYGGIVQMAPLTVGCWHAAGDIPGLGAANRMSVGIELVGHGRAFPGAQVLDAARVLSAIVQRYRIERRWAMVEHATIDPARRSDPGPIWMTKHAPRVLAYAYY